MPKKLIAMARRWTAGPGSCLGLVLALALAFAPTVAAQDYLIDEIIRKADRAEQEGGFCARTNWRMELSTRDTAGFYDNAQVGTSKVFQDSFSGTKSYCAYLRIEDIYFDRDRRCLRAAMWWCEHNLQCGRRSYRGCWPGPTPGSGQLTWER